MSWIKLNDSMPAHQKFENLPDAAKWLYVEALCHSNSQTTDGVLTLIWFKNKRKLRLLSLLIKNDLIETHGDDYRIKNYLKHQSSKAEIERKIALKAANNARQMEARAAAKNSNKARPEEEEETEEEQEEEQEVLKDLSKIENPIFSSEITSLADFFADSLEVLGCKRPRVSAKWLTTIDLMIRLDKRTPEQIRAAITWAHKDDFWASNILSPASLRKNYEQLRMKATQGIQMKSNVPKGLATLEAMRSEQKAIA